MCALLVVSLYMLHAFYAIIQQCEVTPASRTEALIRREETSHTLAGKDKRMDAHWHFDSRVHTGL